MVILTTPTISSIQTTIFSDDDNLEWYEVNIDGWLQENHQLLEVISSTHSIKNNDTVRIFDQPIVGTKSFIGYLENGNIVRIEKSFTDQLNNKWYLIEIRGFVSLR